MERLQELRELRGWNMRETAKALEIPYTTYVNYEKGSREPNSEMLIKLSEFYNVSIDYLLGATDEKEKKPVDDKMLPPITLVARAGRRLTREQQETILKFAKFTFPEAFKDD